MSGAALLRRELAGLFADVLAGIDVASAARAALRSLEPPSGVVRIIAAGKAAPAMMRGALERFPDAASARVVAPDGVACGPLDPRVAVHRAAHPVSDDRSVAAANLALQSVQSTTGDLVIALISGGASSLLCAPFALDLGQKRALLRALLHSGADIGAINTVRRHASRIKGGGLARAAAPARVHTLIVSDVLDGAPYDIGSGPTVADPTTCNDARAVLARYAPAFVAMPLCESLKPDDPRAAALTAQTILSADDLATSVASALRESGYDVNLLASSGGDVAALAADYAARASSLAPGAAVVRAAEPTVVVSCAAPGRGGRSSHLAALVARTLPEDVVFLAGASDGVDGDSDSAGAVVDRASLAPFDVDRALAAFATADVHAAAGTALVLGPTGVNLADVHVLARARREAPRS